MEVVWRRAGRSLPKYHRGAADQLHYTVGTNDFTFELHFSLEPPNLSYKDVPDLLEVSGGEVLKARRLNPPSNLAWEVPIRPTQNGDIGITLPARECTDTNAVCVSGRKLSGAVSATVRGLPLSASFARVPAEHDGSPFILHFSLSREPDPMSFVTMRDAVFDVTGGVIEYVRRVRPEQNREWELRVRPSSLDDDVTLTLRETTACDSPPGICAGGQKLPGGLTVTVPGPGSSKAVVAPLRLALDANYPNPFNTETQIVYILPAAGRVALTIYNVLGQRERTLVEGPQSAGRYQVAWDGRNEVGAPVTSGVYFYRLTSEQGVLVRRLLLLK